MTYVIGTAGHVDHGKSTLVTALTGIDPDRLAEEKKREMTIDLGFAWLTLPNGESVGVVDVPGHRDFIENMLAGVGGIDLALLVIAADEGVMPQTREHLAILDLLEVGAGLVVLTKTDLVTDPDWLNAVSADVREVLAGTRLAEAPLIPVSARTGVGLEVLVSAIEQALTLTPPRPDRGKPRLPVDRMFTLSGFGTVVTGTLSGGSFKVGDEVEILPSGRRARIRGLQSHKEKLEIARPGSRVAINLTGIEKEEIQRGNVVAQSGMLAPTTLVDVRFRYLADRPRSLHHNTQVKFFSGAAEVVAYVRLVGSDELQPGEEGWLQVSLEAPLALDQGDRFILRLPSPAEMLGGGIVLDAHPAHRWRRFKPEVVVRFETLAHGNPEDRLLGLLDCLSAISSAEVIAQSGLQAEEATRLLAELTARGEIVALGDDWLIGRQAWQHLSERLVQEVSVFHQANPLRLGIPREELRSRLNLDQKAFARIISLAVDTGQIVDDGPTVRLPDFIVRFTPTQQALVDRLISQIHADRINTPSVKDSADFIGSDVLQALFDAGIVVQVSPDVLFDAETINDLTGQLKDFIGQHGSITVAQARDLFNTSRKYVLALLEYLDEQKVTKREGDARTLR